MSTINGKEFKCPKCGCNRLEEVLLDVVQSTEIAVVHKDGSSEYGDTTSNDGGELDRIQCLECGKVVATSYEDLLDKEKELTCNLQPTSHLKNYRLTLPETN